MKLILRQKIRDTRQDGCIRMLVSLLTVSGRRKRRISLVVWWLRLSSPNAGAMGLVLGQGTMIRYGAVGKKKIRGKETDFYSGQRTACLSSPLSQTLREADLII